MLIQNNPAQQQIELANKLLQQSALSPQRDIQSRQSGPINILESGAFKDTLVMNSIASLRPGTGINHPALSKPKLETPKPELTEAKQNIFQSTAMVMLSVMSMMINMLMSLFGANNDADAPKKGTLGDNLIQNGGFDNHDTLKRGGKWDTFKQVDGWKADKGHIEIQNGAVGGTKTAKGNKVVELDAHRNSTISQKVNIQEGGKYQFSMDAAMRGGNSATNGFEVLVNGEPVHAGVPKNQDLTKMTLELDLPPGEHTISIRGTGKSDSIGTIIDNIELRQMH